MHVNIATKEHGFAILQVHSFTALFPLPAVLPVIRRFHVSTNMLYIILLFFGHPFTCGSLADVPGLAGRRNRWWCVPTCLHFDCAGRFLAPGTLLQNVRGSR